MIYHIILGLSREYPLSTLKRLPLLREFYELELLCLMIEALTELFIRSL